MTVRWNLSCDYQWFFGGAFAIGDGSSFNGSTVVQRSVALGEPVIYVNFNYRVNAFGWLAGKEVLAGGVANNGLYDREYHPDQETRLVFLITVFLGSFRSNYCQKNSSWPGSKCILASSVATQTISLCEFNSLGLNHESRSHILYYCAAGARAQEHFPSLLKWSQAPPIYHSVLAFSCVFPNPETRFGPAEASIQF